MERATWFAPLWFGGWIAASVVYRRLQGKPVLFFGVRGAIFQERQVSGCSNRNWLTRIGGASRCLVVAVVSDRVVIRPWFPFTLMFLPELYKLEFDVSVHDLLEVQLGRSFSKRRIDLTLRGSSGRIESLTLYLRNPAAFLTALGRPVCPVEASGA